MLKRSRRNEAAAAVDAFSPSVSSSVIDESVDRKVFISSPISVSPMKKEREDLLTCMHLTLMVGPQTSLFSGLTMNGWGVAKNERIELVAEKVQ